MFSPVNENGQQVQIIFSFHEYCMVSNICFQLSLYQDAQVIFLRLNFKFAWFALSL